MSAKFSYTATNKEHKIITGKAEAANRQALIESLQRQDLRPMVIKPVKELSFNFFNKKKKVKLKELVIFTRQLSTMITAGVPLNKSLATLQDQASDKYFKTVIAGVSKDVEGGMPIGDALSKYPNVFSQVYVNMVRAGEAGGILDDILKRLAAQVEKDASIRKKIKSASMYPLVVGTITVVAFFGIMIFIMPRIGSIIKDLAGEDAQLPFYSQIMLNTSDFVKSNAFLLILLLSGIVFGLKWYIKTPKGRRRYHLLLLKTPIVKNVVTKIAIARFSRTFASLMSAGVAVLESLEVTGAAVGNEIIEEELKEAAKAIKNGSQLSTTLAQSKYFPPIVAQMLAVGEETGQIDKILLKVADFYEEEVDALIDGLSALIEPIMIVILGTVVGLIAASVMGPISSLSKNIGG